MIVNYEKIKEISLGAVRVVNDGEKINFYRFTEAQEEMYKNRSKEFYMKSFSTSGVRLSFKTDSKNLSLDIFTEDGSSREFFSLDVFVNGSLVGCIDNFSDVELPAYYSGIDLPLGDYSGEFSLGEGDKEVCIYFPWSVKTSLKRMVLDDGAYIEAIKPKKTLIAYGDSITQGYDALRPSNHYVSRLCEALDAEQINKAIGAEVFHSPLAALADDVIPEYVTVAYGTNDWNRIKAEDMRKNCSEFYRNIRNNYPDAKIFAITPIWRKDLDLPKDFPDFLSVDKIIRELVADIPEVYVISGFDFVEKNEKYFADLRLHPNDDGFAQYFDALLPQIKENI